MYSEMDVTLTLTCGVLHLSCYPANPLHSQLIVALLLLAANCQVNVRQFDNWKESESGPIESESIHF